MTLIKHPTLTGEHVRLEPLDIHHHDNLVEAVKDGELWKLWFTFTPSPEDMRKDIIERLQLQNDGQWMPFAIIDLKTGKAIGMTAYLNVDMTHKRVEIGATWIRKSAQGTNVNTECKLMLLEYAFETLNCISVQISTHCENKHSQRAIERLGAKLDGKLRNHMICKDKTIRETYLYSIIDSEWASVKAKLTQRLQEVAA